MNFVESNSELPLLWKRTLHMRSTCYNHSTDDKLIFSTKIYNYNYLVVIFVKQLMPTWYIIIFSLDQSDSFMISFQNPC